MRALRALRALWITVAGSLITAPVRAQDLGALASSILSAIDLPTVVVELSEEGISVEVVGGILDDFINNDVPPGEATDVLTAAVESVRDHGPVDNFGSLVQSMLASGLRGQELAQAIREEHQERGRGRGAGAGGGGGGERGNAARGGREAGAQGEGGGGGGGRPGGNKQKSTLSREDGLEAAAIANEIEEDPGAAAQILERHGKTLEEFEGMLYVIAVDPELTGIYREARR